MKLVAVNVIATFVLLEFVALVAYYVRNDALYYSHDPQKQPLAKTLESTVESYRIHPYLGYVLTPTGRVESASADEVLKNNYGFEWNESYPYSRRDPQEFIVGLFGGSAAAKLAQFEARERVFAGRLAEVTGIESEHITVLNFAQGGFKQPQQLLIYNYFCSLGQEFDMVINFDGFNDITLAGRNVAAGIAIDMPSFEHMRALQDVTTKLDSFEGLEQLATLRQSWSEFVWWHDRAWQRQGWESKFAIGFLFDWMMGKFHERRHVQARQSYTADATLDGGRSWLYLNPGEDETSMAESMERVVTLWSRSSVLLHQAAAAGSTSYLHVVQPNQYYETARVFSEAERKTAISSETPYAAFVESGYPMLKPEINELREQGVAAFELFRIFDQVPQEVYIDDCCHFTDEGQRILLERIGELAVPLLGNVGTSTELRK
ncbi:MAG: hypothetical protein GY906_05015 [bacterium]|nr:hypothetical protein [bacterium]